MAIYARDLRKAEYVKAPQGMHRAVCFACVYKGIVATGFGPKEKIELYWQIEEIHPEYNTPFVVSKRYNQSFHENSTLYKDTESWRGAKWEEDEIEKLDIESLAKEHMNCTLSILHEVSKKDGKTYANVMNVNPAMKGSEKLVYVPTDRTKELIVLMDGNFQRKLDTLEATNPATTNETDLAAANGEFEESVEGTPF